MRLSKYLVTAAALALLAPAALASDFDWKPDPVLSLKLGMLSPQGGDYDLGPAYGVELAVNDPLLRPSVGAVRDMISYNHFDTDGLRLQTVEWNAHYMAPIAPNLSVGAGPGLGFVWADPDSGSDAAMWALNLGASATYELDRLVWGFEARYQWTQGDTVGSSSDGADNWLTMVKLGYRF